MLIFPNCKINLGLHIGNKRNDGYHNLETVFYPLPLYDAVEIVEDFQATPGSSVSFTQTGLPIPGHTHENICIKAFELLKEEYPFLPPIKMHLQKQIPTGGGLGGGSADAVAVIQLLQKKFNLHIPAKKLQELALQLGSDCPFFLLNSAAHATGRGEILQPIALDLKKYEILIVNPQIHIATGWAFNNIRIQTQERESLAKTVLQPIETWRKNLHNDFESVVFNAHPLIKSIKDHLYEQGAMYASLSGSGSTVYGLFPQKTKSNFKFPTNYFCKWV